MYWGVRYAGEHVDGDEALAGLLLTGSGDVFTPGGGLGGGGIDRDRADGPVGTPRD